MDRRALLWTLVVFFGASIVFRAVNEATEGQDVLLRIAAQVLVLGLLVAAITVAVRRRRD